MKKKKKKMNKSNHSIHPDAASASASACGGGEVRRVHIIYFLSWRGRMEHPHLIRLHHYPSSNGGIRLRDVKRWVSAVRGKDMPQLFSWSYKRRYKKGYVWQDLVDQDLITPFCDNQYILKGSQIPSPPFNFDEEEAWPPNSMASSGSGSGSSESTATTTLTDDSLKLLQDHRNNHSPYYTNHNIKQEEPTAQEHQDSSFCSPLVLTPKEEQGDKMENPSFVYSKPSNKNKNKNKKDDENPRVRKGLRSYSSNMFRSLITCGAVNTNDSAMVKIKKRDKGVTSSGCMAMVKLPEDRVSTLNAAAKIPNAGSSWAQRDQRQHSNARRKSCEGQEGRKLNNQMPVSAAYRPINGPKCSQCGKMFKPEKMHKHMESCRGMKSLAKGSGPAAADKPRKIS